MLKIFTPILLLSLFMLHGCSQDDSGEENVQIQNQAAQLEKTSLVQTEKEYMVIATRPNTTLHLVDLEEYKVVRKCELPVGTAPGTVVMSPDNVVAYVLSDRFSDVYGINIDTCETVFSTQQSVDNIRVKSMMSIAISPDGSEIYTHQNRVKLLRDHYEILDTKVAVFDTSAGLKVKASRSFDAPRQITTMDVQDSGELLLGGQDIFRMDVNSGKYEIILPSLSYSDPEFAPRDVLTAWNIGRVNNEFFRLYSTAKYKGEAGDLNNADWLWGYERVDLTTGETEAKEFGPLNTVMFSGIRRPGQLNKVYGVFNHLKEFDADTQKELRSLQLEHSYYAINISHDGSKLYLSGALDDIAVYSTDTFIKIANIPLSGDGGLASNAVFKR